MPNLTGPATQRSGGHPGRRYSVGTWAVASAVLLLAMPGTVAGQSPSAPSASTTLGAPDEALVQDYRDQGTGAVGAVFLAMTQTNVQPVGDLAAHVTATFPTGSSADMLVTLVPGQAGDPGHIDVDVSPTDPGLAVHLSYFVPYAAMPSDVEQTIRAAVPTAQAGFADSGVILANARLTASSDGVTVVVAATVDRFGSHTTSEFLKILKDRLGTAAELDGAFKAAKALDAARSMGAMSDEYAMLQARIDAAARCAGNPTHPLTKMAYQEDPGSLERILQQVESTRSEVRANTLVSILGLLNKTGSSLIKGVPWLGYVVGPATAWSKATLKDINEQLVAELERAITPCTPDYCAPATVPEQPDTGPDSHVITGPTEPTTAAASCAAMTGTITWTYHREYIDPADPLHSVSDDRIVLDVRFDRQGSGWVDVGSTFIRAGEDHETDGISHCDAPGLKQDSSWASAGSFPHPPSEDDSTIDVSVDDDGWVWLEAFVVATLREHKVMWSGGQYDQPCDKYETDGTQGGYEWAWPVSCGPDGTAVAAMPSDDGRSVDLSCSESETVPLNTGTETTSWDVTGMLSITP